MGTDELHAASEPAREKADNLVFLNIQKLDSLKTTRGEERTDYWDRALRGFGVRVYPTGRKAFTVRYTLHGELRRRSLGVYRNARGVMGGEVSYSEARAEAERILSEARHGRDPFIGVTLLRNADISTFEGLCRKELIPAWGHRDPNSIQRPEIQHWAKAIADGKGRKKAAPYLANRSVDYMAMIYSWAVRREILRYTPFLGLTTTFQRSGTR